MQIERKIETVFRWWNNDVDEIDYETMEQLEEEAEVHIRNMRNEGYTSGELNTYIDDVHYEGWWEYNYV